jgi:CRISP-associated protein Cas1
MLTAPDFQQKQIVVALISHGEKLSFKNDNIVITNDDGIKYQSTCYRLFALFVVGHITVTTGLLQRAKKFGFSIVFLTHGLTPYGCWQVKAEGNVLLRRKQYAYTSNAIAQHLVSNKIDQQIEVLQKRRNKSEALKEAIFQLESYKGRLPNDTLDLEQILGIEGIASRVYFQQMFDEIGWRGRKPRVKPDIANCLLDIGYTQLFNFIDALLNLYGFDTYQGVYHQVFYQRKSLVCDLVEPFRPLVDDCIRKAHMLKQIHDEDFDFNNGQYLLKVSESKKYIALLLKSLLENKQEIFMYIQGYYRAFMQDKPIESYPVFKEGKTCS